MRWCWLPASGLEVLAALAASRGAWPLALALHAASSGCAAAWLHRSLLDGPAPWSLALVFAALLLLPALGPMGLAALALTAPPGPEPAEPDLALTPIPAPPELAPAREGPRPGIGRGRAAEARLAAVAALRERNHPAAIARLRRALGDPDEEVRLLAHAVLESKSRAAHGRVQAAASELAGAPPPRRAALQRRLAMEHWELGWLGLAEGEALDEALAAARRHARAALEAGSGAASLHLMLGRIALRRGDSGEAVSELLRAAGMGLPAALLAPYLAEAAFLARRPDLVRRSLAGAVGTGEAVERLRRYWS